MQHGLSNKLPWNDKDIHRNKWWHDTLPYLPSTWWMSVIHSVVPFSCIPLSFSLVMLIIFCMQWRFCFTKLYSVCRSTCQKEITVWQGGGLWCYTLQVKYGKVVFSDTQKIRYPLVRWTISTGFIETFKQIVMYILVSNVIYSRHSCLIKKGDRSLYKASNISARTVCYFLEKNKQP